jgi:hypothetical protein
MVRWETTLKTSPERLPKANTPATAPLLDTPPRSGHGETSVIEYDALPCQLPPVVLVIVAISDVAPPKNLGLFANPPLTIELWLSTPSWVPQNAYEYALISHFFIFIFTPIGYRGEE